MDQAQLIKRAILSEKTYKLMESGIYTFLVARSATKGEIAKSVEKLFDVKVARVNVLKKAAKAKRIYGTRKYSRTGIRKKAVVVLQKGQTIGLFTTKKESKTSHSVRQSRTSRDKQRVKDSEKSVRSKETKLEEDKSVQENKGKGLITRFRRSKQESE